MEQEIIIELWSRLLWPLLRISALISVGLVVANFIEAMNWTYRLAVLARPLIKLGRLSALTGAGFTMAFFSGVSANSMLAEAYDQGKIVRRELVLANLFNSLPRFFLHLPTVFFLTVPLIEGAALIYIGITFAAALLQTLLVVLLGRFLLPGDREDHADPAERITSVLGAKGGSERVTWRQAALKCLQRFKKRIRRILKFLIPVYIVFFLLNHYGMFDLLENFLAEKAWFLSWLPTKSLSIVIMHVGAEFSAGLAAAGAMLANNSLTCNEVVMALLAGNVLAAPLRAIRHQLPYYLGIFPSKLAFELVGVSQVFRIFCIVIAGFGYYQFFVG